MTTVPSDLLTASRLGTGPARPSTTNLTLLLERVHRGGPASRAQLTRESGLNRSTVGALVTELVRRGLVVEDDPDPTRQVGRPSPIVRCSPEVAALAVVPETDAVTVAVVDLAGAVRRRFRCETGHPPSAAETVELVRGVLDEAAGPWQLTGLGLAVPGLVRASDGLVRWAPHLEWRDEPLGTMLGEATGLEVLAANDANAGVLAEHLFGAAQDATQVLYLNGGPSGIGGGIIINGELVMGAEGYAGEFGHTQVAPAGEESRELEAWVSRQRLLDLLGLESASDDVLADALRHVEDEALQAEVLRQLDALALGVREMVNALNPQRVVLGGFLGSLFERAPEHLLRGLQAQALRPSWESVSVVRAALGSDLLLVGAAELVFQRVIERASLTAA
ncbi:ROK family transcriptional regulator [Desertihabitans brevis]|uniref:ROK family transcriptional regulator n=1 Tax=Desertihabitans brevis TaxID=2268447 RepID=UPI0018F45ED2|nr:ROK family transcriptional regulator [Desertihabitans brevis]